LNGNTNGALHIEMKTIRSLISKIFWKLAFLTQPSDTKEDPSTVKDHIITIQHGPLDGTKFILSFSTLTRSITDVIEGRYDTIMYGLLDKLELQAGSVIWDVGAHQGYHSLGLSKKVGGQIIAFEPNPFNRKKLEKNISINKELVNSITVLPYAISNSIGTTNFFCNNQENVSFNSGAIGFLEKLGVPSERLSSKWYQNFVSIEVEGKTIDEIVRLGYPEPEFIKLDVEGAEYDALEGGHELLSTKKPILFIEVHNIKLMFQVHKYLSELNYKTEFVAMHPTTDSKAFLLATP
jgi:FkbM family methyltransferase